jgi:hypothetical protein
MSVVYYARAMPPPLAIITLAADAFAAGLIMPPADAQRDEARRCRCFAAADTLMLLLAIFFR